MGYSKDLLRLKSNGNENGRSAAVALSDTNSMLLDAINDRWVLWMGSASGAVEVHGCAEGSLD